MTALSLLLLLTAHPAPARAAPAGPIVHRWVDGLTLLVQPVPGATSSSLRVVVRAGGSLDPPGKAGLAHLVEHVMVEHGEAGRALIRNVRSVGGVLNAHTGHGWTTFELDAPAVPFGPLAERYLRLVTGPTWQDVHLLQTLEVVDREADFRGDEQTSLLDAALFPSPAQTGPLIGSQGSRDQLTLADVQQFFRTHYVPDRMIIVVTGAMPPEEAVALVDHAYLIPPVPGRPPGAAEILNVPVEQDVPSFLTATALGYVLHPGDLEVCDELAALLELRLVLAVREGGPRISDVGTTCARLRGYDLILAFAYTSTLDAPELPGEVDAVFRRAARDGPTADERMRLERRWLRERERILASPEQLADRLGRRVAEYGVEHIGEALPGPLHSPQRLREAAARSLVPGHRFQLNFALRD
jgi:zinc protease